MTGAERFDVFRFRWSVQVIAEIHDMGGARFVSLLHKLGISRSVLSSTLQELIVSGLVMRNPGHGHPLRPEYLLTGEGEKKAPFCREILLPVHEHNAWRLIQSRWAFRILFLLHEGDKRFSELKTELAPITARALSGELKLMVSEGYIERKVLEGYPPATLYVLAGKSFPFIQVLCKRAYRKIFRSEG